MKFSSFDQFKKTFPKIALLMEDPKSGSFVKDMKAKVESGTDLTVKMRRALEKIANEQELSASVEVPEVGKRVALAIEIFQNKTEKKRSGVDQPVLEFKTTFGVRGRLQLGSGSAAEDSLLDAIKSAGMHDEEDKGQLHVEVTADVVWKKEHVHHSRRAARLGTLGCRFASAQRNDPTTCSRGSSSRQRSESRSGHRRRGRSDRFD